MLGKLILFNGPRRVGKDTVFAHHCEEILDAQAVKMAWSLKRAANAFLGVPGLDEFAFEKVKLEPLKELHGMSYVQFLIWLSEDCIKPKFGKDFFGQCLARAIQRRFDEMEKVVKQFCSSFSLEETHLNQLYVCSDSGFRDEALPLVKLFGAENVLLVKLHREGCAFTGDSRGYIDLSDVGVKTLNFYNNFSLDLVDGFTRTVLKHWWNGDDFDTGLAEYFDRFKELGAVESLHIE